MEQLFIQILVNSPVLIAVLIIYAKFDKRCALIEQQTEVLKEQIKCLKISKKR
jgi:hypothetical protein